MTAKKDTQEKHGGIGRIFRRKRSPYYWLQFGFEGRDIRESTDTANRKLAEDKLRTRIKEVAQGTFSPRADHLTIDDLENAIKANYQVKGRRSTERLETSLKHLTARLALVKATRIPEKIPAYVAARMEEGASAGSIRLELLALGKALKLVGLRHVAERMREHIPAADPSTVRKGFLDEAGLATLLSHLREDVGPAIEFAFYTGMRKGEFLGLRWTGVDREAGTLTLRAEDVKNSTARTVPYRAVPRLEAIIEEQWERAQDVLRRTGRFPERVFFRANGDPIRDFRTMWRNATRKSALAGLIPHDLRRSAARVMTLRGIPDRVVKAICGWKTDSTLRRYQVLSTEDLGEQMKKLGDHAATQERAPGRATAPTHDESA